MYKETMLKRTKYEKILHALNAGPATVAELAEACELSYNEAKRRLNLMRMQRLVTGNDGRGAVWRSLV